jgi:putative glutamate/gamma-aminobutyrate antiporter
MKRSITIFSLIMINIAALGGLRAWAPIAECGTAAIFFLLMASLLFFIPVSLVSAELATAWPKTGGVYVWVKEAFGHRMGFLAIWLLWIENVIWYPTILSFIAGAITYLFNPELIHNKTYTLSLILGIFWGTTFLNLLGIRIASWVSTIGAMCGTFIPSCLIIILGALWFFNGHPMQISFNTEAAIPDLSSLSQLALFAGVIMSLVGIEMSAIHAGDVENPRRNYPKALFLSTIVVMLFSVLGVVAIAMVVPQNQIVLCTGPLQAFSVYLEKYNLGFVVPAIAVLIAFGAIGSMSTWLLGPCRGLVAASAEGDLPSIFRKINKHGMPNNLLIGQAVLVSLIALVFLLMPSVNSAYWILIVLTTQLYLVMYILMFAAAIKLRYSHSHIERPFKIPGGAFGLWMFAGFGILSAIFTFIVGFFPPNQIDPGNTFWYVGFLSLSIIFLSFLPSLILRFSKKTEKITPIA